MPRNNNNSVPRNNNDTVPRNNNISDSCTRNPLESIPSTTWYNSNLPLPSASSRGNVSTHSHTVPRITNHENSKTTQVRNNANCSSPPPKKKRDRKHRRERCARERENRGESFIHDARWANQRSAVPGSPVVPARVTQSTPQAVNPISPMRTAVYTPPESVGNSSTNENSPFQIGLESRRNLGLYKPAVPDQNQDTWAYDFAANSSEIRTSLTYQNLRSEQLRERNRGRNRIPSSAAWETPWCVHSGRSSPARASSPSTPWPAPTWESYAAAGSPCKPPTSFQAT